MKRIIFLASMVLLSACSSTPKPRGYVLPPALSEVFRGGELAPLQKDDAPELGMPAPYDLVSHTCTSDPIFGLDGHYVRTAVKCF